MEEMNSFFAGVGEGAAAGIWEDTPRDRPEFRERYQKRLKAEKKKVEEPV
jgi:chlorophyllide a reductase subunit Y